MQTVYHSPTIRKGSDDRFVLTTAQSWITAAPISLPWLGVGNPTPGNVIATQAHPSRPLHSSPLLAPTYVAVPEISSADRARKRRTRREGKGREGRKGHNSRPSRVK